MDAKPLLDLLEQHHFEYQLYEHEPAFTVEEGKHLYDSMPGAHCKSLFLKDKKGAFFLVCILNHKRADLKALSKRIRSDRLSFATPHDLKEKLKLTPGSVTPYGLIHDLKREVAFFVDSELLGYEVVNFHPLRNDMTLGMKTSLFLKFFELIQHPATSVDIPIL